MSIKQSVRSKTINSAIRQAVRTFMAGQDGISGAALLEFTIFAPLLVVSSIYTMDFGLYFFRQMEVQNAAQASAQYAIVNDSAPLKTDYSGNGITISGSATNYYCPSSAAPYSLASATQNQTCADGSAAGKYITITTTATYTPLVNYGFFSGSSYTITGAAVVRIL